MASPRRERLRRPPRPQRHLRRLLELALRAAGRAAHEILEVYSGEFAVHSKQDATPVTEADHRAHRVIAEELTAGSPYPVLSEEGLEVPFAERRSWPVYWLVDPLDGTKEFVKRNGEFTVNVALIERQRPVLGVVYAPVLGLLYFAARGVGAYKAEGVDPAAGVEGAAADVLERACPLARRPSTFSGSLPRRPQARPLTVMASRSHSSEHWDSFLAELRRMYPAVEVITLGSALKSCFVAEGRADLYLRFGTTMEWDTAASQAVVEAVGRRVRVFPGRRRLRYNKPSLANPAILVC